eukprot:11092230-Alexandrium_andersonii.AAC.1
MVFGVLDQCLMACCPRMHTPPLVDLRVSRHPAKSVSMYARRVAPPVLPRKVVNASWANNQ